jgi:hypothetical protein
MPLPRDTVQPEALPDAVLLATTGGLLDAVVTTSTTATSSPTP